MAGKYRTPSGIVKFQKALRGTTKEFFYEVIDDQVEAQFWQYFISGGAIQVMGDDGQMVFIKDKIDPVQWAAFKRAVEYKRGAPMMIKQEDGANKGMVLEVKIIGQPASAELKEEKLDHRRAISA